MALRLLGYDNVWYLNGGITRWQREGRPIATPSANSEPR
jgi:3-mercaptopyruvate sulfurtransferase SseA